MTLVRPENSRFEYSDIKRNRSIKTVRERLLLSWLDSLQLSWWCSPPLVLYGVLDFSVLTQRRDIGIRIALGAQNWRILQEVTSATFAAVALGADE